MKSGDAAAVPLLLKDLAEANDAGGSARNRESLRADFRSKSRPRLVSSTLFLRSRIRPKAPRPQRQSRRLGSTVSPATDEEAIARADRLYSAKRFNDALTAYSDAFAKFPATATTENQLRRGIAAYNATKNTGSSGGVDGGSHIRRRVASRGAVLSCANLRARPAVGTGTSDCRRNAAEISKQQFHSEGIRRGGPDRERGKEPG